MQDRRMMVAGCGHDGRLGNGNEKNQHKFVELKTIPGQYQPKAVIAGGFHTFVITDDGTVFSFGLNEQGQLGLGTKAPHYKTPQLVTFFEQQKKASFLQSIATEYGGRAALAPSCGLIDLCCGAYHTIAWMVDGLYVCGANDNGQLGLGDFENRIGFIHAVQLPLPIDHLHRISCGTFHTVLVASNVQATITQLTNLREEQDSMDSSAVASTSQQHTEEVLKEDGLSSEQQQLKKMIDKALSSDNSDSVMLPFAILACGKGDFGELGYDADEWDKLSAMEKRLKQHVTNKAQYVSQGGKGDEYADFTVGGTQTASSGGAKFKPKPNFKKAPVVRRPEFSSHTFRRVPFPFLDGFGVSLSARNDEQQSAIKLRVISSVEIKAMHHHTAVEICSTDASPRLGHDPKRHLYHFGCLYCNQIESAASSAPRSVPDHVKLLHAGDEIFFTVTAKPQEVESDKLFVIGKGNLGLGEEDDFQDTPQEVLLPPLIVEGRQFDKIKIDSITGRFHFFIRARWTSSGVAEPCECVYTFGDNFMGQTGLNSEENAITVPTLVPSFNRHPHSISCGTRHTVAIVQ